MNVGREVPQLVEQLRRQVEEGSSEPLRERDLLSMGIEPSTARRQFQKHFGMSFHAYQRARRMGSALAAVRKGTNLLDTQLAHGFESSSGFREAFAKLFGTVPSKANGVHCLFARWIETPLGGILALANDSGLFVLDWVDRRGLEREILRLRGNAGGQKNQECDECRLWVHKIRRAKIEKPGKPTRTNELSSRCNDGGAIFSATT